MRDKILILSTAPLETNHKTVAQLFSIGAHSNEANRHIEVSPTQNIVKGITWRNKYYKTVLDLYIDVIDDEWLTEFHDVMFDELRDHLGGIIVLSDKWDPKWAQKLVDIMGDETFLIWCLTHGTASPVDEIFQRMEIVTVNNNKDDNLINETRGIERMHEIIDNYAWESITLEDEKLDVSMFYGNVNL